MEEEVTDPILAKLNKKPVTNEESVTTGTDPDPILAKLNSGLKKKSTPLVEKREEAPIEPSDFSALAKQQVSQQFSPSEQPSKENTEKVKNPLVTIKRKGEDLLLYQIPASLVSAGATGLSATEKLVKSPEASLRKQGLLPVNYSEKAIKEIEQIDSRLNDAFEYYSKAGKISDENKVVLLDALTQATERKNFLNKHYPEKEDKSKIKQWQKGMLNWAIDRSEQGSKISANLINNLSDINDPLDAFNWLVGTVVESGVQIPAAVATMGTSAIGQSIGGIYMDGVIRIAQEKGITPQQVIDRGLDDPAASLAFGAASGILDAVGAKSVLNIGKKEFAKSLRQRTIQYAKEFGEKGWEESKTEFSQTILEQIGAGKDVDLVEAGEAAVKGYFGGGVTNAASNAIQDARTPKTQTLDTTPISAVINQATESVVDPGDAQSVAQAVETIQAKVAEDTNLTQEETQDAIIPEATTETSTEDAPQFQDPIEPIQQTDETIQPETQPTQESTEQLGQEPENTPPPDGGTPESQESNTGDGLSGPTDTELSEAGQEDAPVGTRKKSLLNRAFEGTTNEQVKASIEKHGLNYQRENWDDAKQDADNFIKEVGMDAAIDAVRKSQVDDGAAAFVWAKAIDDVGAQMDAATSPEEVQRLADLQSELISEFDKKARSGGRFNAALQDVYATSDFNYKSDYQAEKYKSVNNGVIPPAIETKFKELDGQLKEANKKIQELENSRKDFEANAIMAALKRDSDKTKKQRAKLITSEKKKEIATFFDSLKIKDVDGTANDITRVVGAAVWNGSVEVMKAAILTGADVANAIQAGIKHIKENYKGEDFNPDEFTSMVQPGLEGIVPKPKTPTFKSPEVKDGKLVIPNSMITALVENGVDTIEELTSSIHSVIKETNPDVTERQVRDAITQYGKVRMMSQDEVKKKLREMKRIGKLISQLEDVGRKIRPLRSGLQRDKPTDIERRMQKELNEAMKDLPMDESETELVWKTALDKVKSRLTNQIADLEDQIQTGKKTPKKKGVEYDDEANALKAHRDSLREALNEIEGKPQLSDEQKVKNAIAAAERSAQEYKRRIKENDFSKRPPSTTPVTPELQAARDRRDALKIAYEAIKKSNEKATSKTPEQKATEQALARTEKEITRLEDKIKRNDDSYQQKQSKVQNTPELEDARKRLKELQTTIKEMREASGLAEKKKIEIQKKVVQKSIDEYQRRINESDFSKPDKKELTPDQELLDLRAKKIAIKEEFDAIQYQNELKNRHWTKKAIDGIIEAWGLTRALRATGEFSFMLLQGGVQTIAHPKNAAKAFITAMSHFASESRAKDWQHKLRAQEYYGRVKSTKLAITQPDAKLTAREESFLGGWVNHIWDVAGLPIKAASSKAYEVWKSVNPFKAVERAGIGYLNTLRLERYLQGEAMLQAQGKTYKSHPDDYKNVADVINTFSGRASLGAAETIAKPLSVIFFSPRNWASVIKQTTPYAFYHFGKMTSTNKDGKVQVSVAQKMAMADYMKYVGLTGSIVMMAALSSDEEDENGWIVEMDPRSSDFLKIKIGNTRIDPWGGRIQMIVLQARLITESLKNSSGEVHQLGTPFRAKSRFGLLQDMVKNKLAPSTSILWKYLDSKVKKDKATGEDIRVDDFGNKVSPAEQLPENLYPIYLETIKELYADQPTTVATFISFLAFLGVGSQTYEAKPKAKKGMFKSAKKDGMFKTGK